MSADLLDLGVIEHLRALEHDELVRLLQSARLVVAVEHRRAEGVVLWRCSSGRLAAAHHEHWHRFWVITESGGAAHKSLPPMPLDDEREAVELALVRHGWRVPWRAA